MRRTLLVLCIFVGAANAADPSFADPGRLARVQALLPEVDKMYADLAAKQHLPGLVYGVMVDGQLIHSRALGFANIEEKIPATSSTRFRIASMTKSFAAMAALKLRDEGKLKLDYPVAKYLPEFRSVKLPTSDAPLLTIRMLMTMTTGLPEDNPWGDRQMARSDKELADLVGGGLSFSSAPGQAFEYSNLGYMALGRVVSKVSGVRFQDYITKQILLPLGMGDTSWEYAQAPAGKLALGYQWLNNGWVREPLLHDGAGAAMGGLLTTIDDFARYTSFLMGAWPARDGADTGPVKRSSVREMQLPHAFTGLNAKATLVDGKTANPRVSFYGYGLNWIRDAKKVVTVGHGGGLPGFGSQYWLAPDHGVGVIAFSNLRYGPVYAPTGKLLATLIEGAALPARAVVPSAILLTRQQQVAQLIQTWDESSGREIAAENFFLDRSREDWIKHAREQLATIGKVVTIGPIKAENRLRGTFPLVGERGTLDVTFTLTPEREPKLQELDIAPPAVAQGPVMVIVRKDAYAVLGREVAGHEDLIALLKERKVTAITVSMEAGGDYQQIGKLIFAAMRAGVEVRTVNGAK